MHMQQHIIIVWKVIFVFIGKSTSLVGKCTTVFETAKFIFTSPLTPSAWRGERQGMSFAIFASLLYGRKEKTFILG